MCNVHVQGSVMDVFKRNTNDDKSVLFSEAIIGRDEETWRDLIDSVTEQNQFCADTNVAHACVEESRTVDFFVCIAFPIPSLCISGSPIYFYRWKVTLPARRYTCLITRFYRSKYHLLSAALPDISVSCLYCC